MSKFKASKVVHLFLGWKKDDKVKRDTTPTSNRNAEARRKGEKLKDDLELERMIRDELNYND